MIDLTQLHFVRIEWLLLSILPLTLLWYYRRLPDAKPDMPSIAPHLQDVLLVKQQRAMWLAPVPLALFALILLSIALAGPSWQKQPSPLSQDESTLIIALDNSRSMQQKDIVPSRWQRALHKARDLVAKQPAGKIGVVAFAGSAHWIIPPTSDMSLVEYSLQGIEQLTMPLEGKYWWQVTQPLNELLDASASRISMVVLTDASLEKQLLAPWQETYVVSLLLSNKPQSSQYDTVYVSPTDKDIRQLMGLLNRHFSPLDRQDTQWQDAGYWLVYPLLVLGLLWFRPGWSMLWGVVLTLAFIPPQQAVAADDMLFENLFFSGNQKGRWYFETEAYSAAAESFDDPLWRGISHYKAKQYPQAVELFAQNDEPFARMMLANTLSHLGEYSRAIAIYKGLAQQALYPAEIANNLAFAQRMMAEQIAMAEAQLADPDEQQATDTAMLAEGDEGGEGIASQLAEQLTAQDILAQKSLEDRWLKHINTDLGTFLSRLFAQQHATEDTP